MTLRVDCAALASQTSLLKASAVSQGKWASELCIFSPEAADKFAIYLPQEKVSTSSAMLTYRVDSMPSAAGPVEHADLEVGPEVHDAELVEDLLGWKLPPCSPWRMFKSKAKWPLRVTRSC